MSLHLVTGPTAEPLHITEVRQHCKVDITDDDALLGIYLATARKQAEQHTRRQIVAARWRCVLDRFPADACSPIEIPIGPVRRVAAVEYLGIDGIWTSMPSTDYVVDIEREPARIAPVPGQVWPWPWTWSRPQLGSVRITFDAGYVAPCVVDTTANTIAPSGWPALAIGDVIRLSNSGGALPVPLTAKTDYYVQSVVSPGVYILTATAGGAAIDLTAAGTGQNYLGQPGQGEGDGEIPGGIRAWILLRCDSLYSYRGEVATVKSGNITPLPYIDRLLDPYRLASL
jgi:uncharacterized phiE125 gp8 family phage protein